MQSRPAAAKFIKTIGDEKLCATAFIRRTVQSDKAELNVLFPVSARCSTSDKPSDMGLQMRDFLLAIVFLVGTVLLIGGLEFGANLFG